MKNENDRKMKGFYDSVNCSVGLLGRVLSVALILCLLGSFNVALAASTLELDRDVHCYLVEKKNSPVRAVGLKPEMERWCYENKNPEGNVFIFNIDQAEVRPELALLIEPDGMLTFASLMKGRLSYYRMLSSQDGFNPLQISLTEPGMGSIPLARPTSRMAQSASKVYQEMSQAEASWIDSSLQEGRSTAGIPLSEMPWRGYWWPYRGASLSYGPDSPMGKYDRFVQSQSNVNPGSMAWENSHHRTHGISWEGHCNGWVDSALLREEPSRAKRDPRSGIVFKVSDQKGLLAEKDYCSTTAFYGHRYNGRPGDDLSDLSAGLFHQVITNYIGQLGKPVTLDFHRDEPVENHIISGYTMDVLRLGPTSFQVKARLRVHRYDSARVEVPGIAPTYIRNYQYLLNVDSTGQITGSQWQSANPDFLWVPLSLVQCSQNNPQIQEAWLQKIFSLGAL